MKLPPQFQDAARHCWDGAVNRQLMSARIHEAIKYCYDNNIALEADDCPPEIRVMLAQLVYLLGMGDMSSSDNYAAALKELGFTNEWWS